MSIVLVIVVTMTAWPQVAEAVEPACSRCFVTAAYTDFLGRMPSPSDLARAVAELDTGRVTRTELVKELASSSQWAGFIVRRLYRNILDRVGDKAGVASWSGRIRSGRQSVAEVAASLYGSAEYYIRAGGTVRRWLTELYHKLLLHDADESGLDRWTLRVANSTRPAVALQFFQSGQSQRTRVDGLYLELLGRRGDPAGIKHWANQIDATGDIAVAVALASSKEYASRAARRFPLNSLVVRSTDLTLEGTAITPDFGDRYQLSRSGSTVHATAPRSNTGGNTRAAFTSAGAKSMSNEQSCATWSSETAGHDQEGAVLRLSSVNGVTKGITVTKNVWLGATWIFNVHVWDTSAVQVGTQIAAFDLTTAFRAGSSAVPFPWTLCARVVDQTVSFIVWPTTKPEPTWDDPTHGGSVTLPVGWDQPGVAGWYIGHLAAEDDVSFDTLITGPAARTSSARRLGRRPAGPRAPTAIPSLP